MENRHQNLIRFGLWGMVIGYTFILPHAIIPYQIIKERYSMEFLLKVPLTVILFFSAVYVVITLIRIPFHRTAITVIPSALIIFAVIQLESNPVKHIHIPEYVIMTWLLYQGLYEDYQGRGFYLLLFVSASMLGVIDELQQGLHPNRYYGWSDMLVNSGSSLVGIFTLIGLRKLPRKGPDWLTGLKNFKPGLISLVIGLMSSGISCAVLFEVQEKKAFQGVYPFWLLTVNMVYLGTAIVLSAFYLYRSHQRIKTGGIKTESADRVAQFWILIPSGILIILHILLMIIAFSGAHFM
ncbi:VanZ family protein [bacterium]|nr:VanZ family protein [bacterium]